MRVRLSEPRLVEELCHALHVAGCEFVTVDESDLTVVHPTATDEREEGIELTFFLRAWQAKHAPAGLELES